MRSKCSLGISIPGDVSAPLIFEWMSSIRPLRYLVVTWPGSISMTFVYVRPAIKRTYSFVLLVKVVDVTIQDLDKELDRHSRIHACVSDAQCTLQTLQNALAITVRLWK